MIWRQHIHKVVLCLPDSWSNWNLKMLGFEERGKPEYPEKNLSEQRREPSTNLTHIWGRCRDLNPGHIGGRRALSPLSHPLLPLLISYYFPSLTYFFSVSCLSLLNHCFLQTYLHCSMNILCFNFMLSLNFILLCFGVW